MAGGSPIAALVEYIAAVLAVWDNLVDCYYRHSIVQVLSQPFPALICQGFLFDQFEELRWEIRDYSRDL